MHEKYRYRFDVRGIIDALGGVRKTHEILVRSGAEVSMKTVQKWRERGNLPADALSSIMAIRVATLDVREYIIREEK